MGGLAGFSNRHRPARETGGLMVQMVWVRSINNFPRRDEWTPCHAKSPQNIIALF